VTWRQGLANTIWVDAVVTETVAAKARGEKFDDFK
jgi:hypothetical protein